MLKPNYFFDLEELEAKPLFNGLDAVWDAIGQIKPFLQGNLVSSVAEIRKKGDLVKQTHVLWNGKIITEDLELKPGDTTKGKFEVFHRGEKLEHAAVIYAGAALMDDDIQIGSGVVIESGALIKGPAIIGDNTEVRQGAYLRGSTLVGRACVVGHVTEMKNSIMLDGAKAGHFAYLGDSVLGREVNLGAGTKLANFKIARGPIKIKVEGEVIELNIRKLGAILGDNTSTGCNTVTSPGTLMGPSSVVAPNMTVPAGYHRRRTVIRPKK
ncbi:MAG: glucose-1-phosphate thymidylyltransferase [Deltaproteobacteria bacterium]|nr:glucose-1-phosphate thymidylyltransferase [Deltaproteobacteria bacterium]MBW2051081.1 glucose-1-phosphate thymidylyltransferase [Deltaproteobacteria bacterium]MBW2141051.1 glucose-1-phosphate thymidylyltransferase [Deltaproteobacteria bacterium]MBW2322591.1 glucose-1-phosphate thymidylyltransferase [Deltaproteobacteria bacterium]